MILKENQSGFRQSYSTLDNIFSIFTLFQILKSKKKKLYCAFIDYNEKRKGDRFSPCLTPISQLKYPVV
jgi:hypothetical protein